MKRLSFLSPRRGSALLIVLGILSFMVVSAVAFSVLMRQSRLPSSFMRQKLTSAQLVKSALASAMAELDEAIGDNPYPGVGTANNTDEFGNWWRDRIFMRTRAAAETQVSSGDVMSGQSGAASTLPLEGLAYIPPPLVNTVRYWMKFSPTSVWQTMGYDAGRYAYTAINVSDYLDINRLHANVMRDSSPSNRVSLAYLFENSDHTGDGTISPESFEQGLAAIRQETDTNPRLVSMADYALAVGYGRFKGLDSPFYTYIMNKTSQFYSGDLENVRLQKFVTDSWYPLSLTNRTTTVKALTDDAYQPFTTFDDGFTSLLKKSPSEVLKHLNFPESVAFKDYLDDDNVPTSLALPTIEYTPMLTGLQIAPQMNTFKLKIEQDGADVPTPAKYQNGVLLQGRMVQRKWKITGFDGTPTIAASGFVVFPFKRTSNKLIGSRTSFNAEVLVKAYLVSDGSETSNTRLDKFSPRPTSSSGWKTANLMKSTTDPCITFYGKGSVTWPNGGDVEEESEAVARLDIQPMTLTSAQDLSCPIYGVKMTDNSQAQDGSDVKVEYDDSLLGLAANEPRSVNLTGGGVGPTLAGTENLKFRWQFFAWVRLIGDDNKTVDLFPASLQDDKTYNNIDQGGGASLSVVANAIGSGPTTEGVLPIKGPLALDLQNATFVDLTAANVFTANPPAASANGGFDVNGADDAVKICCGDPRYNWAPEDWYAVSDLAQDTWLNNVKSQLNGSNCRSRDIFQFVSNQAYLQSLGEFQFLPLVRKSWSDFNSGNPIGSTFCASTSRYNGKSFASRTSPGNLANADYMWKTYTFFPDRGSWSGDDSEYDPYNWGIVDSTGGAAVSPYAADDLFMAAIANTPYDYAVAAEPEAGQTKFSDLNTGRKYCFSAFSNEAKVEWTTLKEIAKKLKTELTAGEDWWSMDAWNSETGDTLFGQTLDCSIHDVDRKFLASYWKSCFANRQQLFLVFVRAEPTVMGAASTGHTPAQLGARAVALVWREPESSIPDTDADGRHPHRMRILFYHQFD